MVLLGAGASADADLPTAAGLTNKMLDHFAKGNRLDEQLDPAFRYVHHTVEADRAARGRSDGADIERLFSVVDLLARLDTNLLTPFVERWHGGIERISATPSVMLDREREIDRALSNMLNINFPRSSGGELLSIIREVAKPVKSVESLFGRVQLEMLNCLPGLLEPPDSADITYLSPLFEISARPITIASLNYDLVAESCAERMGVSICRGVDSWLTHDALDWGGSSDVDLLKLHGSMDWSTNRERGDFNLIDPREDRARLPGVIFGEGNKLRADGPFLPLFGEFSSRLTRCDDVLVVGYSFRDDHVNSALMRWADRDCRAVSSSSRLRSLSIPRTTNTSATKRSITFDG